MSTVFKQAARGEFSLIAEIGVNYHDIAAQRGLDVLEAAKLMVREAKEAGVTAVKFQSYKADTLVVKEAQAYWDVSFEATSTQFELFSRFDKFGETEFSELSNYCRELGIEFMSTPFDLDSVDYLVDLVDAYKISSSDLSNLPFIEYTAKRGKPVIISTGASDLDEVRTAVGTVRRVNDQPLILMHCVLEYPTPYEHANLRRISALQQEFPDLLSGYSDHTMPDPCVDVLKSAYLLGARTVEKHFTLDAALPGNDHYHAMTPQVARQIVDGISFLDRIMGVGQIDHSKGEEMSRLHARRSLVTTRAVKEGEKFAEDMLTFKRPGTGISPAELPRVLQRSAAQDIGQDEILQESMLA